MEFREIKEQDREQVEALWAYCFEKREESFFKNYFEHYCYEQNVVWGAFEEGSLQSMLHLNPYTMQLRGVEQSVPYIVGVATAEEARGKHLMGELVQASLRSLREQGRDFVYLMPIYAGIYLPYGFAFCYERLKYTWEKGKLSLPELKIANKELSINDGNIHLKEMGVFGLFMADLYDQYIKGVNGAPKRTTKDWEKLFRVYEGDGFSFALVTKRGRAIAYLIYGVQESCVNIVELVSLEPSGKLALLQYAEKLEAQAETCEWLAEAWDKIYLSFNDASQAPQRLPFMMARCINVAGAISKLPAAGKLSGEVVLKVSDELLEENSIILALKGKQAGLEVEKTSIEPQVSMDIAAFTQLYFGLVTATELYEAGKVQCTDTAKLQLLEALFPKTKNWINEYY